MSEYEPGLEDQDDRLRRWRLVLGRDATSMPDPQNGADRGIDGALSALYDRSDTKRKGDLSDSAPNVARWLGNIRRYFPSQVVQILQRDAINRLNLHQLLLEPELLGAVVPDIHLAATLVTLNQAMPVETRETARHVVRQVVQDILKRLEMATRQAVTGSLSRSARNRRPRFREIDWARTIRANLKHYQPDYHTIIPHTRIGFSRRRPSLREVILCIDQSGSMATSVVYASVFGAVLASLPALTTRLVLFDTAVVDLTEKLEDPVEVLFGAQLGGGTDINRALAYCQSLIRRPLDTILILISDLYEGGNRPAMLKRAAALVESGVQVVALLALNDDGAPAYDHDNASALSGMGIPAFACTPDVFPDLIAAAISRQDVGAWAAARDIVTTRGDVSD